MHRQAKYLNNVIEADHGKPDQLSRSVLGFKTLKTAYATIKDFEVMRALHKEQAHAFNITRDIQGEARIVERTFGLGASAWPKWSNCSEAGSNPREPDRPGCQTSRCCTRLPELCNRAS